MEITKTVYWAAAVPHPFDGTPEEARENFDTHSFDSMEARCWKCDCRPWGTWAQYPCGSTHQFVQRYMVGDDGSHWREVAEVRDGIETVAFIERLDQPVPEGA